MKLATNFARPRWPIAQVLLGLALFVLIAAIAIAVAALVDAHSRKDETARERVRLERWREQIAATPTIALPADAAIRTLKTRVEQLNRLHVSPGKPLPELLQHLENALPDPVYLVHLAYRDGGEIQMIAESSGADTLTAFLVKLQQDAAFAEAMLTRQSQRTTNGQRRIQFEIRLREAGTGEGS